MNASTSMHLQMINLNCISKKIASSCYEADPNYFSYQSYQDDRFPARLLSSTNNPQTSILLSHIGPAYDRERPDYSLNWEYLDGSAPMRFFAAPNRPHTVALLQHTDPGYNREGQGYVCIEARVSGWVSPNAIFRCSKRATYSGSASAYWPWL